MVKSTKNMLCNTKNVSNNQPIGCFIETLRIENGVIYNFDMHQERMHKTSFFHYGTKPELKIMISDKRLTINSGNSQANGNNLPLITNHLSLNTNERIKCRVLYSSDIITVEFSAYSAKEIRSLCLVEDNGIEYNYKFVARDALNNLFAQRKSADDIIIVRNGNITDSSFSNLVFETFEGELFTPRTYLLAGTKRKFLLESGIIKERDITVDDIFSYKKVYLINAMLDIEDDISVAVDSILTL